MTESGPEPIPGILAIITGLGVKWTGSTGKSGARGVGIGIGS